MRRIVGVLLSVVLVAGCSTYAGLPPTRSLVKLTIEHPGASQRQMEFEASSYLVPKLLAIEEVHGTTCVVRAQRADIYVEGQARVEQRELLTAVADNVRQAADLPPQVVIGEAVAVSPDELSSATVVKQIEYADLVVDRAKARKLGGPLPEVGEALRKQWLAGKRLEDITVKSVTLPRVVLSDFAEVVVVHEPDRLVRRAPSKEPRLAENLPVPVSRR